MCVVVCCFCNKLMTDSITVKRSTNTVCGIFCNKINLHLNIINSILTHVMYARPCCTYGNGKESPY